MKVELEIPGPPVAKQRPRTRDGRTYTLTRTRRYEDMVATLALAKRQMLRGSLVVTITLVVRRELRGDVDNYAKAVLDGLVKGRLIADDSQVRSLLVSKMVGPLDITYVTVENQEDAR